ncbi:hypothetical protein [Erythrobacter sp. Alg231-14]|uniref:hypothetical protein n=1 Tax=Erythrobacter sp. Alg231-14 TaxID=1922225 RepID=UPI00307CC1D7
MQGFIALCAMLSIYIGARLVTGSLGAVALETVIAFTVLGLTQFAMTKWLPSIGIAIFFHGMYDAVWGPHTGVADWYPPLCAGFDGVVGLGLLIILLRKQRTSKTPP